MLEPDRDQIEIFIDALLRHRGHDGFLSFRAFYEDDSAKPFRITPASLKADFKFLADIAEDDARRAAQAPKAVVFCPPLAVFSNKDRAREEDIALGLVLSVECDQRPMTAGGILQGILGPATIIVRSGGIWTDANGDLHDKLHLHWRLTKPAKDKDSLAKLKLARDLAARLVGRDPTNKAVCHPIRWPGSLHRKAKPRLCNIAAVDADQEIDLDTALLAILDVAGGPRDDGSHQQSQREYTEWIDAIDAIINGKDLHNSIVVLAAKLSVSGINQTAAAELIRGIMSQSASKTSDLNNWQARYNDIDRAIDTAWRKFSNGKTGDNSKPNDTNIALPWIDMSRWDDGDPPPIEWSVSDLIPRYQVGLFSGVGGTGKTTTELLKDVAHVTGLPWFNFMPIQGAVIYVGCEDPDNVWRIRLTAVAKHFNTSFVQLKTDGFHLINLYGQDATLFHYNSKSGRIQTTALYDQIYQAAGDLKPINISLDPLARIFSGSEIDRAQVYGLVGHAQALALASGGSVTFLSHPSLHGIASGSGLSGSTAWHDAFRFRQYLRVSKDGDDDDRAADPAEDNGLRELVFMKNQYGPPAIKVVLRYRKGLFLPESSTGLDKTITDAKADQVFLDLLDRLTTEGRNVSASFGSRNYAPTVFAKETGDLSYRQLDAAMRRLFAANKIRVEHYGRPSNLHTRLARRGAT
jgi:RecA-family ATPase